MITDLAKLREAVSRGQSFQYRPFWGHRPVPSGKIGDSCFSQWWSCTFTVAGQGYSSAEQFMMAEKARLFGDADSRAKILAVQDPAQVKKLGRGVVGFDGAAWEKVRFDLVTAGNVAKFAQNEPLKQHLLGTCDEILVEASPTDAIWGIGRAAADPAAQDPAQWRGLNLLGFALGRARAILRGDLPPIAG